MSKEKSVVLRTMGNVSFLTWNHEQALADYLRAHEIAEDAGDDMQVAACLANIAMVYSKTGRNDRALEISSDSTHESIYAPSRSSESRSPG